MGWESTAPTSNNRNVTQRMCTELTATRKIKRITLSRNTLIERFYHLHICFAETKKNFQLECAHWCTKFIFVEAKWIFYVLLSATRRSIFLNRTYFFFGCCFLFIIYLLLWLAVSSLRVYVTLVVWLYFVVVHLLFFLLLWFVWLVVSGSWNNFFYDTIRYYYENTLFDCGRIYVSHFDFTWHYLIFVNSILRFSAIPYLYFFDSSDSRFSFSLSSSHFLSCAFDIFFRNKYFFFFRFFSWFACLGLPWWCVQLYSEKIDAV